MQERIAHGHTLRKGRVSEVGRTYLVTTVVRNRRPIFSRLAVGSATRACTKSRRAKVRQGKNGEEAESRVVHERSEPYLTQHHRAQVLFVQSLVNDMRQAGQQGRVESCAWMIMPDLQWFGTC